MPLPKWKCHKIVEADKITGIAPGGKSLFLESSGEIEISDEMFNRLVGISPVGGYFVRYSDGYESWSPAKAFEEGYARLGGGLPGDMGGFDDKV